MRQIPSSENSLECPNTSYHVEESPQARKARIEKNRAIRKNKLSNRAIMECGNPEVIQLSREQRAAIQKVKNREAAQKSRQQKKMYVQNLEKQILQLKQKLKQKKYCEKCGGQISKSTSQDMSPEPQMNFFDLENNQQQSYFMRLGNEDSGSYIGKFIVVCMIVIAVVCFSGGLADKNDTIPFRDLMAVSTSTFQNFDQQIVEENHGIQQEPQALGKKINPVQQLSTFVQVYQGNSNGLVPLNEILTPFNNKKCMKNILSNRITPSIEQITHLRAQISAKSDPNVMICHWPRIYRGTNQKSIFGKQLDIIVSGKDMREMTPRGMEQYELSNVFDDNSIFQIRTEIKQIIKLDTLTNCLG